MAGAPAYHIRCLNGASQLLSCRARHCTDSSCWRSRCHGRCASGGDGRARVVIRSTTASREPRGDPRLIMEYGKALDQRDWLAFANLFAKNGGEWVGAMGAAKGRLTIQKLMEDTIEPSSRTSGATGTRVANVHVFSNETIDIRGDTATGLTKWLFVGSTSDNKPQPLLLGHYVDTFVRENGEWKFQRRLAYGDIPANQPKASN
jgi:SnoaL-like domain